MAESYSFELIDQEGRRKYHNRDERRALLRATATTDASTRLFVQTLLYTGVRVSEGLAIKEHDILLKDGPPRIRVRTLKKQKGSQAVYRVIPIPAPLADHLITLFNLGRPKNNDGSKKDRDQLLWPWSRQTAWKKLKVIMLNAGIPEHLATGRALRHGYGVSAVLSQPPMPATQLMLNMGHTGTGYMWEEN